MVNDKKLIVSASPHVHSSASSQRIMLDVVIALIPALIAAVSIFGPRVLAVAATTIITCVLAEFLARKAMKRPNTIGDFSAVVTGLLLALNLPVSIPLWIASLGSVVAIIVVKQFFGGIGQNFVNPAIAARIVLLVSFPTAMGKWTAPFAWKAADAVSAATPLASLSPENTAGLPSLYEMFIGARAGSLGETCAAALIIGGIYLLVRKVISPAIPLTYIGTVAVISLIAGKGDFTYLAYQLMSGGVLLGSIFMATDYATSPINFKGKLVYGVGCGLLTMVIRLFGSLPEGVSYAILLMNIFVPLIERATTPKPFGTQKPEKKAKEAAKV